jgi:AmmeMemoRadiSam system protein A
VKIKMNLSKEEKSKLLKIARTSIASIFTKQPKNKNTYDEFPIFKSHAGAFVTITIGGSLRGCIGYIVSDDPLYETVSAAAVQSATADPRFPPLSEREFTQTKIEISVLSEPFPLSNYDDIELGVHGLILEESGKRGLLLPQVPTEHNMNKEQYLNAICKKSGFPSDYWKKKQIQLSAFTATVFSEGNLGD